MEPKVIKKACIIAQSGGPTAAINSSLLGIIEEALKNNFMVYGALNGIEGILNNRIIDLGKNDVNELSLLKTTPSAALGTGRYHLHQYSSSPDDYLKILNVFKTLKITCFFYIGGNDSMDTCHKIGDYFKSIKYDCRVIGIPKTIDNDLIGTDHTPGYGSSIKYIANTLSEIYLDTHAYQKGRVTIVEIMGRNAGWLTASAKLASLSKTPVDLIYLPESPFNLEDFLKNVDKIYRSKQKVLVAVSEGIKTADGEYLLKYRHFNKTDSFGHLQLGGVAQVLCEIVGERLGYPVRSIELNLPQRCASHLASLTDLNEAYECGRFGFLAALNNETDKMVIMHRDSEYHISYRLCNIAEVANGVKYVPDIYINKTKDGITDDFIKYALPLINGEMIPPFENGFVRFAHLDKTLVTIE